TPIEVFDAVRLPVPAVPAQVAPPSPVAEPRAEARVRRGPARPPEQPPPRPSTVKDLVEDVTMRYDDPSLSTANPSDEPVDGERAPLTSAIASGSSQAAQDGLATLQMPVTQASVSLARPPRAKHDYNLLRLPSVRQFAGQRINVELTVDEHGVVSGVRVLHGI